MTLSPEKIIEIAKPYDVPSLYKYRSFDDRGLIRIFTHQEIYFASPTQLNDPFDCIPILEASESKEDRIAFLNQVLGTRFPNISPEKHKELVLEGLNNGDVFKRENLEKVYFSILKDYGIYCLSEINNDILMWSHYANSHTGICIEFDASIEETLFWYAFKIRYKENIPIVDPMIFDEDDIFLKSLAIKSNHWQYEQERRVIKMKDDGGFGIYYFKPSLLKAIILGARVSRENEELIRNLINHYPSPVQLFKACRNKQKYTLDIVPNNQ